MIVHYEKSIEKVLENLKELQKDRRIRLHKGASLELITSLEKSNDIKLPDDYKAFLTFSNGADFKKNKFELHSVDNKESYPTITDFPYEMQQNSRSGGIIKNLLTIGMDYHHGLDGDVDIHINKKIGKANINKMDILYIPSSTEATVIAQSFTEFLDRFLKEPFYWLALGTYNGLEIPKPNPKFEPYNLYVGHLDIEEGM